MQIGKGHLKRVAREKGQAHSEGIESQNQILRSKCQGTMAFTKDEEIMVHKKQCGGFTKSSNDYNLAVVAARQHLQEPWIRYAGTVGGFGALG